MSAGVAEDLQAGKNCVTALKCMAERRIPPHPRNYAVWYEYCRGANRGLAEELERFLASGEPVTSRIHEQLYDKYFGAPQAQGMARAAADEAQQMFRGIVDTLLEATDSSRRCMDRLTECSRRLQGTTDLTEVQRCIEDAIAQTQDMVRVGRALQEQLQHEAERAERLHARLDQTKRDVLTDPLTGLHNRQALEKTLGIMADECRRAGRLFSALLFDIDHFKRINDAHGRRIGDAMLRVIAKTIAQETQEADFGARHADDEFVVLLPDTPLAESIAVAERIRTALEAVRFKVVHNDEMLPSVTLSIGATQARPTDTPESLIDRATKAMQVAKYAGGNTVKAVT